MKFSRSSKAVVLMLTVVLFAACAGQRSSSIMPHVRIEGPIQGGERGYPYASSIVELAPYGYTEEEYFISGQASSFKPAEGTTLTKDGRWQVEEGDLIPYTTRVLVRKPSAKNFNGTVVVEFMQEYFGSERDTNYRWSAETLLREGFGWVGVSLHHEGIDDKTPPKVFTYGEITVKTGMNLVRWDAKRYANLSVPNSDLSYDILTQVGKLVEAKQSGVNPLFGQLGVKRVIAAGNTIAAKRLSIYINAVHPRENVFDGFYLQDWTPSDVALSASLIPKDYEIRGDIQVPVVVLNTTTAAVQMPQQLEAKYLRFWTPAGSSHTTGPYMVRVSKANERDLGQTGPLCPENYANNFPLHYIVGAAIVGLDNWVRNGDALPSFPQLTRVKKGEEWVTPFDKNGNSLGGLRTPWVDTPFRRYDWRGECPGGSGRSDELSDERMKLLYGTPEMFHKRFESSVQDAVERGVLLPDDAADAVAKIKEITW